MTNFKKEAYTPSTIGEIKFRIPLYQRPYAWEIFQIDQLMKDLNTQFIKDRKQKYYIGILNVGKTNSNKEQFDIIDGQQRITTLILIGKVLVEFFPNWNIFNKDRLELYGRKEDQIFLEKLDKSFNPNPKMVDSIDFIRKYVEYNIPEQKEFSQFVYEKASFFITEVPEQYTLIEKNLQFVRMNNRGKQLEAHDVLKIKLSSEIKDSEKQKDFIVRWNKISQLGCQNIYVNESEYQNDKSLLYILGSSWSVKEPERESEIFYQSIVSFSEFLLIALDRFLKKRENNVVVSHSKETKFKGYRKDKLLEEFGFGEKKVEFKWSFTEISDFIIVLQKQYELFDRFIIKRDKEDKYKFSERYKENLIGSSLLELQVFQSFLYVSREPYQHNWLIDAFDYLENSVLSDTIDTSHFLAKLKHIDNLWIANNNNISLNYDGVDRYWFWRLDYYLWENKEGIFKESMRSKEIAGKYIFRLNRSIEHVAPKTPKSNSLVMLDKELMNSFGNLAMISSGQNSSLQNESFEVKRAHVEAFLNGNKSGTIESLKMLAIYDFENWNEENIYKHSDQMINVLVESFSNDFEQIKKLLMNHLCLNH